MSNDIMSIDQIIEVPIEKIRVNPNQPRKHFSKEQIQELAASIEEIGMIQPPIVRFIDDEEIYELISGERRFRASQHAGLSHIPVILRETDTQLSAEAALVENVQRVDLNPIEVSQALRSLSLKFGLNQDELAQRVGKKRSTVANYLRLLTLPPSIQKSLEEGNITTGHAKAILSTHTEKQQNELHELILKEKFTVRQTEKQAAKVSGKKRNDSKSHNKKKNIHLEAVETRLQEILGTKAQIQGGNKKGKIIVNYYNSSDLERLLKIMGLPLEE